MQDNVSESIDNNCWAKIVAHVACVHTIHSDVSGNGLGETIDPLGKLTKLQKVCVGGDVGTILVTV